MRCDAMRQHMCEIIIIMVHYHNKYSLKFDHQYPASITFKGSTFTLIFTELPTYAVSCRRMTHDYRQTS